MSTIEVKVIVDGVEFAFVPKEIPVEVAPAETPESTQADAPAAV
jgi:hypothetical protein